MSFFNTAGGVLALYGAAELAQDATVDAEASIPAFRGVTVAINLESESAVDEAFEQVRAAGGRIVKPPQRVFWGGYSGYFADPDGHLWEIAHNPGFTLDHAGNLVLPDFTAG